MRKAAKTLGQIGEPAVEPLIAALGRGYHFTDVRSYTNEALARILLVPKSGLDPWSFAEWEEVWERKKERLWRWVSVVRE